MLACLPPRNLRVVNVTVITYLSRPYMVQTNGEASLLVERTGYDMVCLRSAHAVPGWEVRLHSNVVQCSHL